MSRFNHSICYECWIKKNPERADPSRLKEPIPEVCCYCGDKHKSGIYVREDPEKLICRGDHED